MKVLEIEYSELASTAFKNYRYGLRIKTTEETYEKDFADLILEVKTKLFSIVEIAKEKREENKKCKQ